MRRKPQQEPTNPLYKRASRAGSPPRRQPSERKSHEPSRRPDGAPCAGAASGVRSLVLVLGDQLNHDSAVFDDFDSTRDTVWMAEVAAEATHVWSSRPRIAMFLSAMRHFHVELLARGRPVSYRRLDDADNAGTLAAELRRTLNSVRPQRVVVAHPGEWRVLQDLRAVAAECGVPLEVRPDRHFLATPAAFAAHARGRKQLRMEYFYRALRRSTGVLMDGDQPVGGKWNFDSENRASFPRAGPGLLPQPPHFAPDEITREVLALIAQRFPNHPGRLEHFAWPVTAAHTEHALERFIRERLPLFGQYQDAMWSNQPFLYHALLSAALNLKLLDPRRVLAQSEAAFHAGVAPLAAVEGFIRQILGWREYVRGVYWLFMPGYLERNALAAQRPLPAFYWTGETELNCLRAVLTQTLEHGYAHHIQRLMVTGLFALLLGVSPRAVHEWYLAVYVDAVEWVELPNTLGMSQYADGGVMASKPYVASGKYIQRMSNYCRGCRYQPEQAVGDDACPFTTLYWDFLLRHGAQLRKNPRMTMQLRNAERLDATARSAIRAQAEQIVTRLTIAGAAPQSRPAASTNHKPT